MMVTDEQDEKARHHLNAKAVWFAGLIIGAVFLFVPRGTVWSSLGLPTHVMGRAIFPDASAATYLMVGFLQMIVALCYAFIVSAMVYRMRTIPAIFTGGVIGLGLYGLNYLVFNFLLRNVPASTELAVAITHVAFCMIVAGAYKGFAVPRVYRTGQQSQPRI
jgi:hypothetical protein